MTWNELAEAIRNMTPEEREQPVRFYESYQDEPAVIECDLKRSDQDITQKTSQVDDQGRIVMGPDGWPVEIDEVAIPAGQPYLA